MVTAYSPILKLALPVQGELSGTWGDVVNDNITSMVEQAIAGRAVIDTWTTNSHVLTTANGTTSESRCAMLEFTDTGTALSGAGTVICPTLSKIYIAKNASGQNVTLKTSGGTGILVPNGRTMFLFCDGTNVVEAVTSTTSLQLGTSTIVTAVLDEDNMASDSATSLATQQSIKAYVDSQVGANNELSEVLANGNTSGANDIIMTSGQKITTNTIDETTAASGVTIDSVLLKDDGVNATNLEITNIKANDGTAAGSIADSTGVVTVLSSILTTADINGGTADGVIIGGTTPAAATVTNLIANTDLIIAGTTTITAVLDEDNMASDSATALATQQSIKAYVDAQVGTVDTLAEILAIGNTTGATDIAVDSAQKVQFRDAAIYINSSVDGQLDIVADTEIQIAATTIDLNGALDVSGTALVTGVLTTTAATVSNGGGQFNGAINVGVDDTGYDVKFFGATTGKSLLWDESADSLIVTGTTTLVGTTNLDVVDIDGATQIDATVTVGVDDTGYDVKFFGATAGAYMLWDESADDLILGGAAGLSVAGVATLASLVATTADINGGTIDGTTLGATTPASVAATTLSTTGAATFGGATKFGSAAVIPGFAGANDAALANNMSLRGTNAVASTAFSLIKLDASDAVQINGDGASVVNITGAATFSGVVGHAAGTALLPSITRSADLNTGMWFPAADTIAFSEGGVEALRIDSSGNVGIGTSTPSSFYSAADNLVIGTGSGAHGLTIYSGSGDSGFIGFNDTVTNGMQGFIEYNHSGDYMAFAPNGSEKVRIDSSGNVGISNSIPSSFNGGANNLVVGSGSGAEGMTIYGGAESNIFFADGTAGSAAYIGRIEYSHSSDLMRFYINNSNAMTIDSSGNLLVGSTDNSPATNNVAGSSHGSTGNIQASVDGNPCLFVNRKSNDGDIISLRKDGDTVGSIGSNSGTNMIMGTGATGIYFNDASQSVHPWNISDNQARNGAIDLGLATDQFRYLYLNGGVVFGDAGGSGTSTSNSLDSYEEGTWTVALASSGTQPTYNFTSTSGGGASYIKVGRMVTIFFDRYVNITVAGTGNVRITGLPFSSDLVSDYGGYSAVQFRASSAFGTSSYVTGYVDDNEILVELGNGTTISPANWTTGTNIRFSGTVTYRTA
jgi:hypothetical protein